MEKKTGWYSNYGIIALGLVVVAVAVIYFCQDLEVSSLKQYLPFVVLVPVFMVSFAVAFFRRKKTINKDPFYGLSFMMYLLIILTVALPVLSHFVENEEVPDWYFAVFFLTMCMSMICGVFKHQQKRIDALEKQLHDQIQSKEESM